ncbi:4-fold beta flower protein [Xanthocytophaga agilis]|uniref:4-fold beta flower domain-containing protein n=1 Tax=Xanthocytophaga agilis TaxID=3048010 RepID=A0AAE3R5Z9_9BACT|nr:hypothetical protein [Xanthocytophaga agilis]MDJ1502045.1 hypothetical protein [Xanthocytophaga agilis]
METTLYDKNGRPVAYISSENDNAIYIWDGHAVCYIEEDKIYGWKGKHIGWFVDNIIYDTQGYRVGFTLETCPSMPYVEPVKYVKYVQYVKYVKYVSSVRPIFSLGFSDLGLKEFLEQDKV